MSNVYKKSSYNDLFGTVSFGGSGSGGGGGGINWNPSPNVFPALHDDPISNKMDGDNSTTQGSHGHAMNGWTDLETNMHSAGTIASGVGGCTGCHVGRYDAAK